MPRTVSATEAKNRLGSLMEWVSKNKDEVIVESHGEPKVVVMSYAEYERIQRVKEEVRRREALAKLQRLRDEVSQRNRDLTPEEADALADRFVRDVIDDMVREGKIRFES
jgi:prevent-host-death family protein